MAAPSPPNTAPGTTSVYRADYEVSRIPMHNGHADGGMFATCDNSRSIWHVTYFGKQSPI
jgi:hypothetical protein